jgi:glycosyltransferase involved in cell wall biosynthesis
MSRVLLNFPETVLKVIDTHDIFTNRNLNYKKMGFQDSFFSTSRSEETKGFNRADVLIAIQKKEEAIIKNMTKTQQVFTIGHKVEIYSAKMRNTARYQILYLGAGNISNIDGINYFIEYILPKLVAKIENVKLVLSGNICNHIVDAPNIEKLGEVKNIEDAYKEADIVINPGRVGTGLKIKNIEALGFGLPLVCTSQAAEGMDCLNNEFMVAAILNLFLNEESYNTQAKRAIDFAENYNENIFTNVKSIFIDQPKLHKIDKTEKT